MHIHNDHVFMMISCFD